MVRGDPGTDRLTVDLPRSRVHTEFAASDLAERKAELATSVAVVIPALNEEATVGRVVEVLQATLVDTHNLIDELVVVDADSTDRTAERARAAGAHVVRQSSILPEAGPARGKGEALWKGLAATSGDLVVFIDADIHDIGAQFVVGLLGPLLTDPDVAFTKATYDRPLIVDGDTRDVGGGRVTELMARPLITTFWPQLAWLAQPLSGEYAGRRALFESLPFVCGYGVELGLLVDIAERHGAEAITQVDLGRRTHDHQSLDALGRMAAEILHTALVRLQAHDRMVVTDPLATALPQPVRDAAGMLTMVEHEVTHEERPPLNEWRATH